MDNPPKIQLVAIYGCENYFGILTPFTFAPILLDQPLRDYMSVPYVKEKEDAIKIFCN